MESVEEIAPTFIDASQIQMFTDKVNDRLLALGQTILERSWNTLMLLAVLLVYMIIVPLLVFFMLKDKVLLLEHFNRVLPEQRRLISQVGSEMNLQIMNYIRGKALEIVIVGVVSYGVFLFIRPALFGVIGHPRWFLGTCAIYRCRRCDHSDCVSRLVPVRPVDDLVLVNLCLRHHQALDGNVLVPILFSEAVALHPVYIIAAVLIFGAMWGFWGVFLRNSISEFG